MWESKVRPISRPSSVAGRFPTSSRTAAEAPTSILSRGAVPVRPRRPFWRSGRIVRAGTPGRFNSFRMIPRFSQWCGRMRDGTILLGRHFSCLTPAVASAVRRSVRIPGETGGADETEEASGTTTPCAAMIAGPSAPASAADPEVFPVRKAQ